MNAELYDKDFGEKIDYLKERTQNLKSKITSNFQKRIEGYTEYAEEAEI